MSISKAEARRTIITEQPEEVQILIHAHVHDLTKIKFTGANKKGLLNDIAAALGQEVCPKSSSQILGIYIQDQRRIWAGIEHRRLGAAGLERRFPQLYRLFSNDITRVVRRSAAISAVALGNATDEQSAFIEADHIRNANFREARVAFKTDTVTVEQLALLEPEHQVQANKKEARVAINTDTATVEQLALLEPEHRNSANKKAARVAINTNTATIQQRVLIAAEQIRNVLLMENRRIAAQNDFDELVRRELANPNLEFALPMIGIGFNAQVLKKADLNMSFGDVRDADKIRHQLHSYFHFSDVNPRNLQRMDDGKKAIMPGNHLTRNTIDSAPFDDQDPGVLHLQNVDDADLNREAWATPDFYGGIRFFMRHHSQYYPFVAGQVLYAYCIPKTIFFEYPAIQIFEEHD